MYCRIIISPHKNKNNLCSLQFIHFCNISKVLICILNQETQEALTDFSGRSPLHNNSKRVFVSAVAVNHMNNTMEY